MKFEEVATELIPLTEVTDNSLTFSDLFSVYSSPGFWVRFWKNRFMLEVLPFFFLSDLASLGFYSI